MLGSNILDTVIGLVLVILMMSLICSAIREIIESVLKQRALDLERGMRELLQDDTGDGLARELYEHPLVYGLYTGEYTPNEKTWTKRWFGRGGLLPSYIPPEHFARVIIDLDAQGKIRSPGMRTVLRSLAQDAGGNVAQLRANIEAWFNSSTERIGGWYKRRTQLILLLIGLIAAGAFNVNPINMANKLYKDADLRAAITATADRVATTTTPTIPAGSATAAYSRNIEELHKLAGAGLPMGWREKPVGAGWLIAVLGWLITAVAVTLGAPFWFDLLNKFMTLRSTIKPRLKQPEVPEQAPEPAGDKAKATRHALLTDVVAAKAVAPEAVPAVVGTYQPNEWRHADEEEGDL